MIRAKLHLGAFGLCALTLGLTALTATPVEAETGAKWSVVNAKGELVEVKSGGLLPSIRLVEVEAGESMLTKIAGSTIAKKCTGYELLGAKLEAEGKVANGVKVRGTGCSFIVNGKISKPCEPHSPGQEKGILESTAARGLLVLHKLASGTLDSLIRIEPVEGETFMFIETGPECAIGEKVPLIGKLTLKDSQNELTTEKTTHLIEQGPLSEVWLLNKTPEHLVTFDGTAFGELSGEHKGLKFSGTPG
jgi:hypothetical protein